VLGAAKTGTTSLHFYLRQHPALFLPEVKELDFFHATDGRFPKDLDEYLDYFADAGDRLAGDATPLYLRRPDLVPDRMRRLYGGEEPPCFLILLRDPVQRAYSHYLHKVSQGTEPLSFEAALAAEQEPPSPKRRNWKTYFADGCYAEVLERWFAEFPRERFCVLLSDDLAHRPDATLQRVFRFLQVAPDVDVETGVRLNRTDEHTSRALGRFLSWLPSWLPSLAHRWTPAPLRLWVEQQVRRVASGPAADRPALAPTVERRLRRRYAPHIRRLAALLNRDLSGWLPS